MKQEQQPAKSLDGLPQGKHEQTRPKLMNDRRASEVPVKIENSNPEAFEARPRRAVEKILKSQVKVKIKDGNGSVENTEEKKESADSLQSIQKNLYTRPKVMQKLLLALHCRDYYLANNRNPKFHELMNKFQ